MLADLTRRKESANEFERDLAAVLVEEVQQYSAVIGLWQQTKQNSFRIVRSEDAWRSLTVCIDRNGNLWEAQNLLWQIEASIICSIQFCEQAKKSFPYSEEQLFLEGYLHEKKKSRRKVEEILRFVQNRIWEQTGFAPYCY